MVPRYGKGNKLRCCVEAGVEDGVGVGGDGMCYVNPKRIRKIQLGKTRDLSWEGRPRVELGKDLLRLSTKVRFVSEGECVLREVERERSCDCGGCGRVNKFHKNFLLSRFELVDFEEEDRIHDRIINDSFSVNSKSELDSLAQPKNTVLTRVMTINKARLGMKRVAT